MKKTKAMLTCIAVVAVVGGVLALKVHAFIEQDIFQCDTQAGLCSVKVVSGAVVTAAGPLTVENATTNAAKICVNPSDCGGTISHTFLE